MSCALQGSGLQVPPTRWRCKGIGITSPSYKMALQRNRDYKSLLQDGVAKESGLQVPPTRWRCQCLKNRDYKSLLQDGVAKESGLQIPPTRWRCQCLKNRDYKSLLQDGVAKRIGTTSPSYKIALPVVLLKKYMRSGTNET